MRIIISLYLILLIVFVILSLIIIKYQEKQNQIYCRLLVKNKVKRKEIKDFIKIKRNDILNKKTKFEKDYSRITNLKYSKDLATIVCLYAVYREEMLLKEIESFINERA